MLLSDEDICGLKNQLFSFTDSYFLTWETFVTKRESFTAKREFLGDDLGEADFLVATTLFQEIQETGQVRHIWKTMFQFVTTSCYYLISEKKNILKLYCTLYINKCWQVYFNIFLSKFTWLLVNYSQLKADVQLGSKAQLSNLILNMFIFENPWAWNSFNLKHSMHDTNLRTLKFFRYFRNYFIL